ncbi:uncharacterized protein SCHCODRAFT_02580601 [Schizophyllum commune H4-8]|uniref:Uncharacterized protein n=1 Tax=Schizophyllum commune (strain H4-8 / FGSC 9210) TaxID=578458 RepID=D8Q851_SCHCM|nr:uncharacterized protein SCHCODRAFT_02580601 [Schizophyllum commune H4-8]KAI5891206.1 hypothetical protein SCHCODRAFT_02580601 [Schizophyllum commune H4-8]
MRFFSIAAALSAATVALAQEAARYGALTVDSGSNISAGQTLSLTYNSTVARYTPKTVDFVLQGTRTNGNQTPYVILERNDYSADQKVLQKDITFPDVKKAIGDDVSNWLVIAYITYNYDDSNPPVVLSGGTTAPITIV